MFDVLSFFGADLVRSDAFHGFILVLEEIALVLALLAVFEGFRRYVRDGLSLRVIVAMQLGLALPVTGAVRAFLSTDTFEEAQSHEHGVRLLVGVATCLLTGLFFGWRERRAM